MIFRPDIENPKAYSEAVKRNIIENARKTFERTYPRAKEIEDYLLEYYGPSEFIKSMNVALFEKYGKLTEKQVQAILHHIDTAEERRAAWQAKQDAMNAASSHIGKPGDRIDGEFEVLKIAQVESKRFHYHDSSYIDIITMLFDGNIFVIKTKNTPSQKIEGGWRFIRQGDKVKMRATIKEHTEYKGTAQTVLQRAKIVEFVD